MHMLTMVTRRTWRGDRGWVRGTTASARGYNRREGIVLILIHARTIELLLTHAITTRIHAVALFVGSITSMRHRARWGGRSERSGWALWEGDSEKSSAVDESPGVTPSLRRKETTRRIGSSWKFVPPRHLFLYCNRHTRR